MYGTVLGPSITGTSAVVLPNTGSGSILRDASIAFLVIGIALTIVGFSKLLAAKVFNA